MSRETGGTKSAADVHLAEYQSLRQEQHLRLQLQFNAVAYLLSVISAIIAVASIAQDRFMEILSDPVNQKWVAIVPLVAAPIAFILLEHILMIHKIGHYLHETLGPALESSVSLNADGTTPSILQWRHAVPGDNLQDRRTLKSVFFWYGPWWLLMMLIPIPTAYVMALGLYDVFTEGVFFSATRAAFAVILLVDVLAVAGFTQATRAVGAHRARWLPNTDGKDRWWHRLALWQPT